MRLTLLYVPPEVNVADMNKSSSSAAKMEATAKLHKKQKQQQSRRNRLPGLNDRNSNSSNASSSSVSVEAPRGCLRFIHSHSSSSANNPNKALSRTPKSAPISRPKPPLRAQTLINGKNSVLIRAAKPQSRLKTNQTCSLSTPLNVSHQRGETHSVSTPATAAKLVLGSDEALRNDEKSIGSGSENKTPKIQSSLSPEIQCGSNAKAATPACYAAGHFVSGVVDKRKCRPRGILTIGDNNDLPKDFDSFQGVDNVENSGVSMLPSPVEASMCWLLSPCREDPGDEKENSGGLLGLKTIHSPSSPYSALGFSLDMCNIGSNSSSATNSGARRRGRKSNYLLSPSELSEFQECLDPRIGNIVFSHSPKATPSGNAGTPSGKAGNVGRRHSPPSTDTLASENVMQTPEPCSSLERSADLSNFDADGSRRHHFDSELYSMTQVVQRPSLSPESHLSVFDPGSLSFQFDSLTMSSKSIDLSHFQKVLDDRSLYSSNSMSSLENMSESQMRISWREGLISPVFEVDEFDRCRCLADEEQDLNICSSEPLKSCQSSDTNVDMVNETVLTGASRSAEFLDGEFVTEGKGKGKEALSAAPYSCAESFSTDGGSLLRSDDSDWSLSYKKNLF